MRPLLLAFLLFAALPAPAQTPEEDARRTIASIEGLLKQRPNDPVLWFYMARFRSVLGDAKAATAALERVNELGEGFLPPRNDFAKVWDDPGFAAVRAQLEARLPRLDYAPNAFEIEDRTLLPEGIAHDAASGAFFIGSFFGRVLRIADGVSTEFAGRAAGLDQVLGLAVDGPRRILYVVSTSALTTEGMKRRRNAVFAFDVDTRRLLHRYEVPGALQLNDVAVAPGGRVFATDSASGAVYEITVKGPGPSRERVPANRIRGSNGLAASADGRRLYVAHSTGLAVLDIATGELKRVANETRESVAGIDGLYEYQGQLIGVQNITNPGRVILISLDRDGDSVARVQTMVSHHHNAVAEPTTGVVTPRGFFLLATTGLGHFTPEGRIRDPDQVPRPIVLRVPLPR